jgi:hypothetical protein
MKVAGSLREAIERERRHPQHVRQDNAAFRMKVALHEAAHAVVGYQYAPWAIITLPFANPVRGSARTADGTISDVTESWFAGCVIDEMMFGHSLFARHDYIAGLDYLIELEGHDAAQRRAPVMLERVRAYLLRKLPVVQALALEVMPVSSLRLHWSTPTTKNVGLERHGGPKKQAQVDARLRQFARTPQALRRDFGRDNIKRAHGIMRGHWERANRAYAPLCSCGCGVAAIDLAERAGWRVKCPERSWF